MSLKSRIEGKLQHAKDELLVESVRAKDRELIVNTFTALFIEVERVFLYFTGKKKDE